MTSNEPRFLDEEGAAPVPLPGTTRTKSTPQQTPSERQAEAGMPRGPVLLEPEPDSTDRLDVGWTPEVITAPPPVRIGTAFCITAGLILLVLSWAVLSLVSFVLALLTQSVGLGIAAVLGTGAGCLLLLYAGLLEVRAYRSLGTVERLRAVLASGSTTVDEARLQAGAWIDQVGSALPDRATVERLLRGAATTAEVRSVLRSQVADRLRERANAIGRQAAAQGATLVAICPHPAWDGVIAAGRGLLIIRRIAMIYGLQPGLAVTLLLLRRVAWTAAGTAGIDLISQGLADHVLASTPVLKHVAAALPGSGIVAVRLYRLAGVTAETCSPVV